MRGLEKNRIKRDRHTDRQTDPQTDGHRDSMIESAQWADSMKNYLIWEELFKDLLLVHKFRELILAYRMFIFLS